MWCSHVFSLTVESPSTNRNEDMNDVLRYSHRHSNYLQQRETRTCRMFSGILIDIGITFNKDKPSHVRCLQVFSSTFELPSTKRNKVMYDVFRYSHRHSKYLRQRETKSCLMSSGILIDIQITSDKEKWSQVWCHQVFSLKFELPSRKRNEVMYDVFRYSHQHLNYLQ
jgi:hypothetical protein